MSTLRSCARLRFVATLVTLLVALGSPRAASAREGAIRFWAMGASPDDARMFARLGETFRQRTGVAVDVTPLGWGDETKYLAAMAAELPPDIGITNLGGPMNYGSVGGLVDLQREFPAETEALKARFYPSILPAFSFRGHLYGVPTEVTTLVVFYRADVFRRLGIAPPTTWSELDAAIRAVESRGMRFYFGWTRGAAWSLPYAFTLPFGYPGLHVDAGPPAVARVDWTEPGYQRAVLQALRLWDLHENLSDEMGERTIGRFLSDDPATAMPLVVDDASVYHRIVRLFPAERAKWDVLPWPRADEGKRTSVVGGTAYVIFEKSKRKADAFRFLEYLTSLEVQQAIVLDRMTRSGEDAAFRVSPVKALWAPENAAFWAQPAFASSARIVDVMADIVPTFETTENVLGGEEGRRLEAQIVDRMGALALRELSETAARHGTNRWQLVQRLAAGELAGERERIDRAMAERLRAEYAAAAPVARAALERERAYYDEHIAALIANPAAFEGRPDVLTHLERAAAFLLLGLVLLIAGAKRARENASSYLFIAPPFVLALVFTFVPAIAALYLSFTDYRPVLPLATASVIGPGHYVDVVRSGQLTAVLAKTALYVAVTVPVGLVASLLLAALLDTKLRGERYWRFVYFSPFVMSSVSVALVFTQLYAGSESGWLNALLLKVGLAKDPIPFLRAEHTFLYCVMALAIWHGLAFNVLVFLAGLQQVPVQLYRAAEIDGAGPLRKFWHVSLPSLRPQIELVTVIGVIAGFQVFEPIYMLGGGSGFSGSKFGPNDAGLTMVPFVYNAGFEQFKMGLASALAYILFVVIFVFTLLQLRLTRRAARRAA